MIPASLADRIAPGFRSGAHELGHEIGLKFGFRLADARSARRRETVLARAHLVEALRHGRDAVRHTVSFAWAWLGVWLALVSLFVGLLVAGILMWLGPRRLIRRLVRRVSLRLIGRDLSTTFPT